MRRIIKAALGYCPCCEKYTLFRSYDYLYREYYNCLRCGSNPRQRAVMKIVKELFPNWKNDFIHESSPSGATFQRMLKECRNYSYSYFYPDKDLGMTLEGEGAVTNQNLQALTFANNVFDIFITQDVLEHVNEPKKAIQEIYRCLKPGGKHIFTVPAAPFVPTRPRIKVENGNIIPIMEKVYHGNPICEDGSLVTYDWGCDICKIIDSTTGFKTEVKTFYPSKENHKYGIDPVTLYIFISTK